MKLLEDRIIKDGIVKDGGVLKVDSFLNHQMDIDLFNEIGKEFKRLFGEESKRINKILTIEASGIGIACIVAQHFGVPVVLRKKRRASISTAKSTARKYSHSRTEKYMTLSFQRSTYRMKIISLSSMTSSQTAAHSKDLSTSYRVQVQQSRASEYA